VGREYILIHYRAYGGPKPPTNLSVVEHRSHPARPPKTKPKPSVSQKWLRATLAGIKGFGNSKTVVQQAEKSAPAKADSHREVWSIRTSGYRHVM